jgi:hypothetical protein
MGAAARTAAVAEVRRKNWRRLRDEVESGLGEFMDVFVDENLVVDASRFRTVGIMTNLAGNVFMMVGCSLRLLLVGLLVDEGHRRPFVTAIFGGLHPPPEVSRESSMAWYRS